MDRMLLFDIGRWMGWLGLIGFAGAALNPVFKWINKNVMMKRERDDGLRKGYQNFLRNYLKAHPYGGLLTAAFVVIHLIIQLEFYGLRNPGIWTGIIAGALLVFQAGLGAYGQWKMKRRPGTWLTIHRWITIIILAAAAVHLIWALL